MREDLKEDEIPTGVKPPSNEKTYFLKNNSRPRTVTINIQRLTDYLDEDGNKWEVKVSCHRDKEEFYISPEEAKELERFKVAEDEKLMIWYKNGRIYSKQVVPVSNTYEVENYPHVLDFHCGKNKYDERIYNIYVGGICEVSRGDDKDYILKIYHFVDEVDEKGTILVKNQYLNKGYDQKMKVDMNRLPDRYEEIPTSSPLIPRQNPIEKRSTEIKLDESLKGDEE
jgi:hypothetical protein